MKKLIGTVILGILFVLFGVDVYAHGVAVSVPKEVGDYILEFEYSAPEIIDGETNSYVFRLLDKKSKEPVVFDSVLVRFERKSDQSTMAIARVIQDDLQEGLGRFTVMLTKGDYSITSSYYKGDKKITETSYDLSVKANSSRREFPVIPAVSVLVGLIAGFFVGFRMKASSGGEK